jgi:feruloyl esterase
MAMALAAAPAAAQGTSAWSTWSSTALADSVQLKSKSPCASVVSQTGYEFSVTTAAVAPVPGNSQEYCRVQGLIQPDIQFEVGLPAVWNGRLYMFGNGGFAGEALDAPARVLQMQNAVSRGFVVAQTNTGHEAALEPGATFAASRQKFLDYAYRAVHVTALTAKRLAQLHYGSPVRRAYFNGCSTGGRQGLISAQRFPDDFDGIVVGAPVLSFSGTMISFMHNQRALSAAPLSAEKLKIVAEAVYAKCDASDGVKDGLIDDPRRCPFKASVDLPRCQDGEGGSSCVSSSEIAALEAIYSGPTGPAIPYVAGWPVGAEIGGGAQNAPPSGWMPWLIAPPAGGRSLEHSFAETFFRFMAFGRPDPSYDWMGFNLERDYERTSLTRTALDATDPDLSRFRARGGKILSYFGWADPSLNPLMGISYYERVVEHMGSSTHDFYRLFMVPGMFHCAGGVGTSAFDAVTPLIRWVEKAIVPASIPAERLVEGKPVRSRPLCPYPEVARYKGSGSLDEAASFSCEKP